MRHQPLCSVTALAFVVVPVLGTVTPATAANVPVRGVEAHATLARPPVAGGAPAPATVRAAAFPAQDTAPANGVSDDDGAATPSSSARTLAAGAATGEIRVDGVLDEPAWADASPATRFVQQAPDEGEPSSQPTEVRVLYGEDALYIGARLSDAAPDSVVARMARRDTDVVADWFYVYLDTYHDRRSAFGFGVSAAGVQRDLRVSADDDRDASWDAVWASAVRTDARGWTAELRVPLSQLRYNAARGPSAAWGLNFVRRIARRNETSHWAPVPAGADGFVSRFGELNGIGGLDPARGVEVVPYTSARVTAAPGADSNPLRRRWEPFVATGADVRLALPANLTLNAAINPDFGQVEADPAVVNLSAFEVFQQERRPFFVEGADVFDLAFPAWPPFFYSRRIGRAPQGRPPADAVHAASPDASTILGALKLTGRTDRGWTVGALQAVTGREHARYIDREGGERRVAVEPLTSYSVGRVGRQSGDGRSGIGLLGTAVRRRIDDARLTFLHSGAYGLALDGWHRFAQDAWQLRFGLLGSHVRGDTSAVARTQRAAGHYFDRPDADHVDYDPARRSLSGYSLNALLVKRTGNWRGGAFIEATSPAYEANDLGFSQVVDHMRAHAWAKYQDYSPGSVFRSWYVRAMTMTQRTFGGERKELTQDAGFFFELLNYWGGGVWVMRHQPAWDPTELRGGPALRKPGRWMGSFRLHSDRRASLSGNGFLFWEVEDGTGGRRLNANASLSYRPSARTRLTVGPTVSLRTNPWQYVDRRSIDDGPDGRPAARPLYFVGELERRTYALTGRLDYAFTPRTTVQLYARPYLSSGRYPALREVTDPAARRFDDRFRTYGDGELAAAPEDGTLRIDRDHDGTPDVSLPDPDFNGRSLQVNAVLRWEYRPGSTLFVVWTHDRNASDRAPAALGRDLSALGDAPGRNILQVKLKYWLSL